MLDKKEEMKRKNCNYFKRIILQIKKFLLFQKQFLQKK